MTGRVLDLFCGAGGAAAGYVRAGFECVGVDSEPMPRYPYEFIQADALKVLSLLLAARSVFGWRLEDFTAIHASPPCQHWSVMTSCQPGWRERYPQLIEPTRDRLKLTGLPWVIENVPRAPLIDPVVLCGTMFDLRAGDFEIRRHRLFETSFPVPQFNCRHKGYSLNMHNSVSRRRMRDGGIVRGTQFPVWKSTMGVPWMDWRETCESIPPAYTECIGHFLKLAIERQRALDDFNESCRVFAA